MTKTSTKTVNDTVTEAAIWQREARAYAQALIDQAGAHSAELAAYAERWVGECVYFDEHHRALFAARLSAYAEAYGAGYDAGQTHGYQNGMEDGIMETKREMEAE